MDKRHIEPTRPSRKTWPMAVCVAMACSAVVVAASAADITAGTAPRSDTLAITKVSANPEPSASARQVAVWAVHSHDHLGRAFVIVDKAQARVWVFGKDGQLQASSPVLLGAARGDHSVPGIGARKIADIRLHERTTPAGRFVAEPGRNAQGEDIVWVDYDAAVSMHRVRSTVPKERRLERLASASVNDNRISYGCINVPAAFYDRHIKPVFSAAKGIVYVLPEASAVSEVFGMGTSGRAAGAIKADKPKS